VSEGRITLRFELPVLTRPAARGHPFELEGDVVDQQRGDEESGKCESDARQHHHHVVENGSGSQGGDHARGDPNGDGPREGKEAEQERVGVLVDDDVVHRSVGKGQGGPEIEREDALHVEGALLVNRPDRDGTWSVPAEGSSQVRTGPSR
jgi:hypothetical protein